MGHLLPESFSVRCRAAIAAIAAALLVFATHSIDIWAGGCSLAAWSVTWMLGFGALALLTTPAQRAAASLRLGARRWAAACRESREDRKLLRVALTDARVMTDLTCARPTTPEPSRVCGDALPGRGA